MRIGIYNNETAESQRVTKVLKTEMKRAGLTYVEKNPEVVITIGALCYQLFIIIKKI